MTGGDSCSRLIPPTPSPAHSACCPAWHAQPSGRGWAQRTPAQLELQPPPLPAAPPSSPANQAQQLRLCPLPAPPGPPGCLGRRESLAELSIQEAQRGEKPSPPPPGQGGLGVETSTSRTRATRLGRPEGGGVGPASRPGTGNCFLLGAAEGRRVCPAPRTAAGQLPTRRLLVSSVLPRRRGGLEHALNPSRDGGGLPEAWGQRLAEAHPSSSQALLHTPTALPEATPARPPFLARFLGPESAQAGTIVVALYS